MARSYARRRGGPPDGRVKELLTSCIQAAEVDGAGLSLRVEAGLSEPFFGTDAVAEALEQLQFTLGEGPCVDAAGSGSPVIVPDLAEPNANVTGRWPMFAREAARREVRAVFAFPLRIGVIGLGVADLYRHAPGPLTREQLASVLSAMDSVTLALLSDDHVHDGSLGAEPLSMTVHRAAGMVMAQLGTDIEEALVRLRATAFSEEIPIDELADAVVRGRRRFQKEQP